MNTLDAEMHNAMSLSKFALFDLKTFESSLFT